MCTVCSTGLAPQISTALKSSKAKYNHTAGLPSHCKVSDTAARGEKADARGAGAGAGGGGGGPESSSESPSSSPSAACAARFSGQTVRLRDIH